MKLILIGVLLVIQINTICGHSLSKIKLKDRSAAEAKDRNSITIPNQKSEKMTLSKIINLNEETFGSKKSFPMATDFNEIRRPSINGSGFQYLEDSEKTSLETDIPKAPKLETLDIDKLPNYIKRRFVNSIVYDSGNDGDHTSTVSDSTSQSDERQDWNPIPRGPKLSKHSDDSYGLNLSEHNGYVWNNLFRPKYKYDVKILPYSGEDSSSEENSSSTSVKDSKQSEDASNTDSNSQEDSVSDSHSYETDSQSHEDNDSDEVNTTNEDTQNDTDESTSNEFDQIVSDVIDNGDDSNQLATDDKDTNVNILAVLNNILDRIVKNDKNKPKDKSNVLHILNGLITNIFNNYISVTSIVNEGNTNFHSNKSNVNSSTVVNAIEPETHNTTDSIVSEQTTAINDLNETSTEDIYTTVETVTSYENLITEAHNDNINYILSTIKDNVFAITEADARTTTVLSMERNKDESNQRETSTSNEIVDTSTKYTVDTIQTTKQLQVKDYGLSDSEDTNIETQIVTENPEYCRTDSKETGDIYKPNDEDKSNGSIEPLNHLVSGNKDVSLPQTEKPILDDPNTDQSKVKPTKDQVIDKEKFGAFMGDLVGQYLAELMSRTSFLIKHEVESQIAKRLEEQKKETLKEDKEKDVIEVVSHNVYGNAIGNEKVTNVYVFNLNKYAHEVMDDVKNIINSNNGTNILTFGKDNPKESYSPKDNDVTNDDTDNIGQTNISTSVIDFDIPIELNSEPTNVDQPLMLVDTINDSTPQLVEVTTANPIPSTDVGQLPITVNDITNIEPTSTLSANVNEPSVDKLVTDIESVTGNIELRTKFKNFITTTDATNKPYVTDITVGVANDSTTLAPVSQTTADKPGESKTSNESEYEKSTTTKSETITATNFNTGTSENEETTDNPTTTHIKIQSTEGPENKQKNTEKSETDNETIDVESTTEGVTIEAPDSELTTESTSVAANNAVITTNSETISTGNIDQEITTENINTAVTKPHISNRNVTSIDNTIIELTTATHDLTTNSNKVEAKTPNSSENNNQNNSKDNTNDIKTRTEAPNTITTDNEIKTSTEKHTFDIEHATDNIVVTSENPGRDSRSREVSTHLSSINGKNEGHTGLNIDVLTSNSDSTTENISESNEQLNSNESVDPLNIT